MKLGLALLCLTIFTLLSQQARADSIRWHQPDCAVGEACEENDISEYRILTGFGTSDWFIPTDQWLAGEIHGGTVMTMPPEATPPGAYVEMRTWRDVEGEAVVSASLTQTLYVPEPPLLLGMVVGIGALALTPTRSKRAVRTAPHRAPR